MWNNIQKTNLLRCLLNEYHNFTIVRSLTSISKLDLSVLKNNSVNKTSNTATTNNNTDTNNLSKTASSQKIALHLVTAYSGFSKENFSKRKIPKINKNNLIFGDDSLFTATQKCVDVMGVADGVGGWHDMGIDPSIFSSSLMKQCKRFVEQENELFSNSQNINAQTPLDILVNSYNALLENKNPNLFGSSTACIVVFNRENRNLYSANLGDSGFVVIRNNKIVHRSQEQYHYFNAPFQMAIVPSSSSGYFNDNPKLANLTSFELVEGDFIVIATDGLWDNLSEGALLLNISNIKSYALQDLEKAAKNISNYAAELSKDPNYLSPFSISAKKHGFDYEGGKPDDITVLLARVSKKES